MDFDYLIKQNTTDFTKVIHQKPYRTIDVTRPELSQTGKTVLVTGGATGIGLSISRKFIEADVSTVILIGRRQDVLTSGGKELRSEAENSGKSVTVITEPCDQADRSAVEALWNKLEQDGIVVDILILNAADFTDQKSILDLGAQRVWKSYEVNVRGPLDLVARFHKQNDKKPRTIVNVSTQAINMLYDSQSFPASLRPAYGLTKNAGTMLLQQIAKDVSADDLQIINFHPGVIYNDQYPKIGIQKTDLPFDDVELPGSFAVWATTKEAKFLHGRFVWAAWDIDEYSQGETRKQIEENVDLLRIGVVGLRAALKGEGFS
ncbi:hypothetical protein N7474_005052 [Penicillium riverlandense]|uniref:uncharacterized protein n=1 Tax=Penicillium riverlandense TaxID=1903569 RepID=UPI002548DD28|nr:uncharacterized protein N7474_005052 [Penicillium riverlandense]KAJ5819461.1 hypothetical protein N7474_005052 [Penicillium riverlandense]